MKLRTLEDLENRLDASIAWRRKELRDLRSMIALSPLPAKATYARAGIALAYAHWEGFVKESSEFYLRFVANQRLNLDELSNNFWALCFQRLNKTNKIEDHLAVAELFRKPAPGCQQFQTKITTRMNLKSAVFQEILLSIGVDVTRFAMLANFIDAELVDARNNIAHGQDIAVQWKGAETILERTDQLLIDVRTEISNNAALRKYLAPKGVGVFTPG